MVRWWCGACCVGVVGLVCVVGVPAGAETPEERCARETRAYEQAMSAAWQSAHPGQTPTGNEWPAYVCVGGVQQTVSPSVEQSAGSAGSGGSVSGGVDGEGVSSSGRVHRWDGFAEEDRSGYRDDMALDPLGATMGTSGGELDQPAGGDRVSAGESARVLGGGVIESVVPEDDDEDTSRRVGRGVQSEAVPGRGVLPAGQDAGWSAGAGSSEVSSAVRPLPSGSSSGGVRLEGGDPGSRGLSRTGESGSSVDVDSDAGVEDGRFPGPVLPVAAAGVLTGVAVGRRRRGGGVVPRVTLHHRNGDEQTIFALVSPAADHTQEFGVDVPEGGGVRIRRDGGADITDKAGRVVGVIDPPWAYDATGKPQPTWYTYDPDAGVLTQHVAPTRDAVYPIIADPNQSDVPAEGAAHLRNNGDGTFTDDVSGTTHPGFVDESGNRHFRMEDGSYVSGYAKSDGSGRTDWVHTSADGGQQTSVASLGWDDEGNPTDVKHIEESTVDVTPAQRGDGKNHTFTAQNAVDRNTLRTNGDGTFTDLSTGTTHKGYVDERTGGRVFQQADGTLVQEIPHTDGSGRSDWVLIDPGSGQQSGIRSLSWDEQGNPTDVAVIEGSTTTLSPQQKEDLEEKIAEEVLNVTTSAMIDETVEGIAGSGPDKGVFRKLGSGLARGSASAGYGAVLGTAMDIDDGMDVDKAIAINVGSSAAGWAGTAVAGVVAVGAGPIAGPVIGIAFGIVASKYAEKYLEEHWDENT